MFQAFFIQIIQQSKLSFIKTSLSQSIIIDSWFFIIGKRFINHSIQAIKDIATSGRICVLDIDTKGVESVKKTDLNPKYIFIKPPCYEELVGTLGSIGRPDGDSLSSSGLISRQFSLAGKEIG